VLGEADAVDEAGVRGALGVAAAAAAAVAVVDVGASEGFGGP